jgi:hypothetical protein
VAPLSRGVFWFQDPGSRLKCEFEMCTLSHRFMELARVGEKEELIKTITARRYEAKVLGVAYAMAADMYADRRRLIGIPAIVLSTFVGAMTLSSLIDIGKAKLYVDIFICVLAIAVAVLTALQTFLDYPQRSKENKDASVKMLAFEKKWELLLQNPTDDGVRGLDTAFSKLLRKVPRSPLRLQEKARERIAQKSKYISDLEADVPGD